MWYMLGIPGKSGRLLMTQTIPTLLSTAMLPMVASSVLEFRNTEVKCKLVFSIYFVLDISF